MNDVKINTKAEKSIEKICLKKNYRNTYTALEHLDFHWDLMQVEAFDKLWNEGLSIIELAEHFQRTQEEIGLLILDRALKDKIKPRKGGLFGGL